MQAIQTKQVFSSVARTGFKLRAEAPAGRKYYEWDQSLTIEQNHEMAATLFIASMKWDDDNHYVGFATGALADNTYAHVLLYDNEGMKK